MLYEDSPSEARFPRYGVLIIKENTQSGHLKFQRKILHFWTAIAWPAGKSQVS
jgi:hypothetical protein